MFFGRPLGYLPLGWFDVPGPLVLDSSFLRIPQDLGIKYPGVRYAEGHAQLPSQGASSVTLTVLNRCGTGAPLFVYPDDGGAIEAFPPNAPISIADGSALSFICLDPVVHDVSNAVSGGGLIPDALTQVGFRVMVFETVPAPPVGIALWDEAIWDVDEWEA